MHTQKTKAVIARQLSQQELNNYFFPLPYPPWAWAMVVIGPLIVCTWPLAQLWPVEILGLGLLIWGLLVLLSIKRANPDDRLYDAWVERQSRLLAQKGMQRLDITRSEISGPMLNMRSYVLPGSFDAAEYALKAVHMKQGRDGYHRFSINVYTHIYPLKNALAIFRSDINALDPTFDNDKDDIYPYRHIMGVGTVIQPRNIILIGEQKVPYRIEQFCLKLKYGDPIIWSAAVKAKPPGSISGLPTVTLPDTGFNRTFNRLRKMLLSL